MAEISAVAIDSVKGWKQTDDKESILVGFEDVSGNEFAIAIPTPKLIETIVGLIDATAATEPPTGQNVALVTAIPTNWFDLGEREGDRGIVLTLHTTNKGHLSFQMNRTMAERLHEVLGVTLGTGSTAQSPDTPRH